MPPKPLQVPPEYTCGNLLVRAASRLDSPHLTKHSSPYAMGRRSGFSEGHIYARPSGIRRKHLNRRRSARSRPRYRLNNPDDNRSTGGWFFVGEFSCFCAVTCLFPDAELWAPCEIPNKFKCLPFAGILREVPPHYWVDDFDQLVFTGNCFVDEVFFFHLNSHTVILADFIQNHPRENGKPLRNAAVQLAGVASPHGGVALDIRLSFTNRNLARRSLKKLLSWDFDKLIIAHGVCIEQEAKAVREAGAASHPAPDAPFTMLFREDALRSGLLTPLPLPGVYP